MKRGDCQDRRSAHVRNKVFNLDVVVSIKLEIDSKLTLFRIAPHTRIGPNARASRAIESEFSRDPLMLGGPTGSSFMLVYQKRADGGALIIGVAYGL